MPFPRIHPIGTDPATLAAGHIQRANAATAKIEAARDPVRLAVTSVRAALSDLESARARAQTEFAAIHAPVANPIPQMIHKDVADILRLFIRKAGLEGIDLQAPIHPHEPVVAIEERHRVRLQAALDEAQAELKRVERDQALARVKAAQDALNAVDAAHDRQARYVEPVPEMPVEVAEPNAPSLDDIEAALADQDAVATPRAVAEDAPKRRGRPPRVVLSPDQPVLPD